MWDLETGALICTFTCEGHVDCAAVAPDGRTVVAGDAGGRVYFLRLDNLKGRLTGGSLIPQGTPILLANWLTEPSAAILMETTPLPLVV